MTYSGATNNLGYDNDGLLTSAGSFTITRNVQNGLPESVSDGTLTHTRTFSGYGELDSYGYNINAVDLYTLSVTRDLAGRIIQRIENIEGTAVTWDYSYDEIGRLIEARKDGIIVESYVFDENGNRISETNTLRGITNRAFAYSDEDHILTAGTDTYQFDVDGFLTERTTATGTTTFNYSSRGELLEATLPDSTVITYEHDPMGRRIAKKINGTTVEKYLWQGKTRLLALYDGNDNLLTRFDYADARMPIAMTKDETTYYLSYDQVGSMRVVVDSLGNAVKRIDYDSFGNITNDTNPTFTIPFGFAGGLHDRDTGLVRFGARDYDPTIGRWTAKDPIDFEGGINIYAYVGNNPVNYVDPLGLYGTNDCYYYQKRCKEVGGEYYCEIARKACNKFPKYPDPDPSRDDDYEGWFRCTRQCLQDCDAEKAPGSCQDDVDDFWDDVHYDCHKKCYIECATGRNPY